MVDAKNHSAVRALREAADDEITIDLGGHTEASVTDLITAAFEKPIERLSSLKVTFVVGGGKQCRQKYDEKLQVFVCNALREKCNFDEDRTADKHSQRAYKTQHDTSKNLKFVHCFPEVVPPRDVPADDDEEYEEAEEAVSLKPEERVLVCPLADLKRIMELKIESYTQQMRLLKHLKDAAQVLSNAETQLTNMAQLSAEEQHAFDTFTEIPEKVTHVNNSLQQLIADGQLEKHEQQACIAQFDDKIAAVDEQLAAATTDKKKAHLTSIRATLAETRSKCASSTPMEPRPLFRDAELRKIYAKLIPLQQLEKLSVKTLDQAKQVSTIPELEEQAQAYVAQSRGWFETAEELEERREKVQRSAIAAAARKKTQAQSTKKSDDAWNVVRRR